MAGLNDIGKPLTTVTAAIETMQMYFTIHRLMCIAEWAFYSLGSMLRSCIATIWQKLSDYFEERTFRFPLSGCFLLQNLWKIRALSCWWSLEPNRCRFWSGTCKTTMSRLVLRCELSRHGQLVEQCRVRLWSERSEVQFSGWSYRPQYCHSSPPLRHFHQRSFVARAQWRVDGPPQTHYTLQRNTAGIIKKLILIWLALQTL